VMRKLLIDVLLFIVFGLLPAIAILNWSPT
jgi:hypothetical protein